MTAREHAFAASCSAVAIASSSVICASSAGLLKQIAGLVLISAFACAVWFIRRDRFDAIVPAAGLTLSFLILAGLALAAGHVLSAIPVALALAFVTLAAVWFGASSPARRLAGRGSWFKRPKLNPLAAAGVLIFAVAAVLAVHYSAASATTDADGASSIAIWAYPSGDQLQVGVAQPAGRDAASLRIVVTQNGVILATWNDVRLAPGQTWNAPPLTVAGNGPAQVVVLHGRTVVASLSSR
jgi:hypothetical protein